MNKIILGNCVELMQKIPDQRIDLIVTDPPYLVNYKDRTGRAIANDVNADWLEPAFMQMARVLKDNSFCVSFYGWTKIDLFFAAWKKAGLRPVGHVVFAKQYASSKRFLAYQHESAYLLAKGQPELPGNPLPDVLPWKYTGNKLHPTQKPVSCLTPLIESFSKPGALVLDPFCGSGSTCEAALITGRRYLGFELDPAYHAAATDRLNGGSFQFPKAA